MNVYKLEWIEGEIERTTWWRDENRRERFGVWWLSGGGLSRPATEVEIDLWLRAEGRCQRLLACKLKAGHDGGCNTSVG